jgi:hypothetical protein
MGVFPVRLHPPVSGTALPTRPIDSDWSVLCDQQSGQRLRVSCCFGVAFGGGDDRSLHQDVPRACKRFRVLEPRFLGKATHDGTDVLEVSDACFTGGVFRAHLEQHVDERARLEVVVAKPFVEYVEDREEAFLGRCAASSRFLLDLLVRPANLAPLEEGEHELVLGSKVAVERRLGDAGPGDHLVDADVADATAGEEFVRRGE